MFVVVFITMEINYLLIHQRAALPEKMAAHYYYILLLYICVCVCGRIFYCFCSWLFRLEDHDVRNH